MPSETHNGNRFRLSKSEILRKGNILDALFLPKEKLKETDFIERHSIYRIPLKCTYLFRNSGDGEEPLQAMFSIPKKNIHRAVKRNLLRRRIKESYRLQKGQLKDLAVTKGVSVTIHFSYLSKETENYADINYGVQTILKEITDKLASCGS